MTDIDDKILAVAATSGVPWWEISQRNQRMFESAYAALGCLPPTVEPRATGHVPEMIVLMRRLIESGHAYAVDGDVYFSVQSFPAYGALSGQDPRNLQQGESDVDSKRDPVDFALWKRAKPGEPYWETPWGNGRPGWHLECSAMATKYLGAQFDIHGGGLDLVFPHHENEQAQSRSVGDGFAQFLDAQRPGDSRRRQDEQVARQHVSVENLLEQVRPPELRYYLAAPHYRSAVDFTAASLDEAATAYRRVEGFVTRAVELAGVGIPESLTLASFPPAFVDAMNDDIGVPQGLAVLHNTVREGNAALADGDKVRVGAHLRHVIAMLSVLGLDPLSDGSAGGGGGDMRGVIDALVALAIEQRTAARERKDYAAADAIRDQLARAGIIVEDTAAGARWQLRRD